MLDIYHSTNLSTRLLPMWPSFSYLCPSDLPLANQALGDEEKAKELVAEQTRRPTPPIGSRVWMVRSTSLDIVSR